VWKIGQTLIAEEELDVICPLEKGDESLTYAVIFDSLIIAYVKFVIMLVGLKKALE